MNLSAAEALAAIERLRYGIPPCDHARLFTVGDPAPLRTLGRRLCADKAGGVLVQAGPGAGKSHALAALRDLALEAGYAVSLVVADAQAGVRFDRSDAIFGAVCRALAVDQSERRGVAVLFSALAPPYLAALSSNGRWDYSAFLQSPALYVALRAWLFGPPATRLLVEDWLAQPAAYRERRLLLYEELVHRPRDRFRDPRPEWKFHAEQLLVLDHSPASQVWAALDDLARLARLAGRRGLVVLFDAADDLIGQFPRAAERQAALRNLLHFFPEGGPKPGRPASGATASDGAIHAYVAVAPDFVERARRDSPLAAPRRDISQLPLVALAPIERDEFLTLAHRIRGAHGLAYRWDAGAALPDGELPALVERLWRAPAPERLRHAMQGVVQALDERLAAEAP